MRIGVLTTGYPHRGDPVPGAFVGAMARALVGRGHAVTVVCAARPGDTPRDDPGIRVVTARGLSRGVFYGAGAPEALGLGRAGGWSLMGPWARGIDATLALGWTARQALAGCDALVSHFVLPSGLLGALLRRGRPHVLVVHGTDGALLARAPRGVQEAILGGATRVWCSHAGLRDALGLGPGDCHVGPMGFDPAPPASTPREPGRVISLGRLIPVKRPALGLEGVLAARGLGAPFVMTVLGDGPLRGRLEALAAGVPPGVVTLAGAVGPSERDRWLARAELLVHTSGRSGWRTEGAPVSLLEAMHAGVAVVATESGGVSEVLGDGGVVLPQEAGAAAVGAALARLHRDGHERASLVSRAHERAAGWAWDRQAERVEGWLRGG